MNTTTIYRINEKDRTIDIAQSVKDTDFRAAVLNTKTYAFDELMDIVALKKLGLYLKPVAILNSCDYYQPLAMLLERSVDEHFQDELFRNVWKMANTPEEVMDYIFSEPFWTEDVIENAAL